MKRILFCLILLLEMVVVFAQEEQMVSVNQSLYEQALKALENRNFIVTYNTLETNRGRKILDSRSCFFEVKGDYVSYQEYNGEAEREPWSGVVHSPKLNEGKASDFNIERKDNGEIRVTMLLKTNNSSRTFYIEIKLERDTNKCILSFSKRRNKTLGKYYTGSLFPIGATILLKGELRRY